MYSLQTTQTTKSMSEPEKTYTTHEIAKFCGVYPTSVVNWINAGKLRSFATPGGHHRITRDDLLSFLREFKIPVPEELSGSSRVMIVDDDAELARAMARAFERRSRSFKTEVCHDGVEALIRIGQRPPDLVVLDVVLPKMDGVQVCRVLKSQPETRGIRIVAVTGKKLPFNESKLLDAKVDGFFRKPLDVMELVGRAAALLGLQLEPAK